MAAAAETREVLWQRKLMADPGELSPPVRMAEDSQDWLAVISNPQTTGSAKHIDIAHHMVREQTAKGEVALHYNPGAEMVANGLTKALAGPAFIAFHDGIDVRAGAPEGGVHMTRPRPTARSRTHLAAEQQVGHAKVWKPTMRECCDARRISHAGHGRG